MTIHLLEPAQAELDEAIAWHPLTPHIRRCRLRRFPYSVVYTQDGNDLLVLAIAHQHRKPDYWRNRFN